MMRNKDMNDTGARKTAIIYNFELAHRSIDPHFGALEESAQACDGLKDLLSSEPLPSTQVLQEALEMIQMAMEEVELTRPSARKVSRS